MATVKLQLGLTENGAVNTPSLVTVPVTGSSVTLLDGRYRYSSALVQMLAATISAFVLGEQLRLLFII